jgi:uncharacterized damage-inducible protein DinB
MLRDALLPEFEREMALTRTMLARVPEELLGWAPHVKSPTMGWLAGHLAMLPGWAMSVLSTDGVDIHTPDVQEEFTPSVESREQLLALFDKHFGAARALLAEVDDAALAAPWTLSAGEQVLFTLPRAGVLRTMVFNHNIHHRAQLGLYLRLHDIPLPATYGPSADEGGM